MKGCWVCCLLVWGSQEAPQLVAALDFAGERFRGSMPCPVLRGSRLYIQHPIGHPRPSCDMGRGGAEGRKTKPFTVQINPMAWGSLGLPGFRTSLIQMQFPKKIDM